MNLTTYAQASVAGVPLVGVIIGLVYWFKSFKRKDGSAWFCGNDLLLISMCIGILLGGCYMVVQTRPPAGDVWIIFVYWFGAVVYGLLMGLIASGIYNVAMDGVNKVIASIKELLAASTPNEPGPSKPQ